MWETAYWLIIKISSVNWDKHWIWTLIPKFNKKSLLSWLSWTKFVSKIRWYFLFFSFYSKRFRIFIDFKLFFCFFKQNWANRGIYFNEVCVNFVRKFSRCYKKKTLEMCLCVGSIQDFKHFSSMTKNSVIHLFLFNNDKNHIISPEKVPPFFLKIKFKKNLPHHIYMHTYIHA